MTLELSTANEAFISQLTAPDGTALGVRDWPLAQDRQARAAVLLVHGLGEHCGRYDMLARQLNAWGFAVRGYDQYGHGLSGGPRGGLSSELRLLDDLAFMVDALRSSMPRGQRLVLLGHSMGGLVAADFVASGLRHVDALVLSSPALALPLRAGQHLLLATLPRLLPNLQVPSGVQSRYLSHDPAVARAYDADALRHDRISARLARYMAQAGLRVLGKARSWCVPTLLLWAGQDKLVDPSGSRMLAEHAPPAVLQAQCFDAAYHEIFNETEALAAPVFERLGQWLDVRVPAA